MCGQHTDTHTTTFSSYVGSAFRDFNSALTEVGVLVLNSCLTKSQNGGVTGRGRHNYRTLETELRKAGLTLMSRLKNTKQAGLELEIQNPSHKARAH